MQRQIKFLTTIALIARTKATSNMAYLMQFSRKDRPKRPPLTFTYKFTNQ